MVLGVDGLGTIGRTCGGKHGQCNLSRVPDQFTYGEFQGAGTNLFELITKVA